MKPALLLLPGLLFAQSDWKVPPEFQAAGYTRETRSQVLVLSGPGPAGAMTQTLDATPYRGQPVRLRAAVRVAGGGAAQLLLRVDRDGVLGFFDNMGDRPIRSGEWKTYELTGEVAADARTVEIGVLSSGKAEVWVDAISFEKLPAPPAATAAAREAISRNYARVDEAYAAGEIDAIAGLATPEARVLLPGGASPLAAILSQIMEQIHRGVKFESRSTVTAVRVSGAEATVWVNNESSSGAQAVLSTNRDQWVNTAGGWKLKESALIATRPMTPDAALAEIRARAGMPDFGGVRILLWEGRQAPAIAGFTAVAADMDAGRAAERAVDYLKEHAPEEAGPAALAFQGEDAARLAAVVRAFDRHRANTPEWLRARQDALIVYQSIGMREPPEEVMGGNVIWLASEAHPTDRILVLAANAAAVAPFVRKRYGKQVYVVGAVPRELLGGDLFLDVASVPAGSALARWLAAQKLSYDGLAGQ